MLKGRDCFADRAWAFIRANQHGQSGFADQSAIVERKQRREVARVTGRIGAYGVELDEYLALHATVVDRR